jgi:hypothetical protein
MAKRKAARRATSAKSARKRSPARSAKRSTTKRPAKRQASARKKAPATKSAAKSRWKVVAKKRAATRPTPKAAVKARPKRNSSSASPAKVPRLDRARRTLDDRETTQTPPSSLDMDRRGTAARTGRAEIAENIREHHGMNGVTGGDPDVDIEDAYFAGEEAPGGDNPTPDQDIVEDIGKALGVTYDDSEELKGANKVEERDKHRWELDPASAEDYRERDKK